MIEIEVNTSIKKNINLVFEALRNLPHLLVLMPDVKELNIVEIKKNEVIILLGVMIENVIVRWKEKFIFNRKNREIFSSSLSGDIKTYTTHWKLISSNGETKINIKVQIEIGLPSFEKYLEKVLKKKTRKSLWGMVRLIRKYIEEDKWQKHSLV